MKAEGKFQGTKKVFVFSLRQTMKNKTNLFTLIVMIVFAAAIVPLSYYMGKAETSESAVSSEYGASKDAAMEYLEAFGLAEEAGFTEDQLALLSGGADTSVMTVSEYESEKESGQSFMTRYFLQYIYSILLMMISILSATYIVRSVVEEKASKLVEMLMVSVSPLALIAGKVLASMCYVVIVLCCMAASFGLSLGVTGQFLDVSLSGMLSMMGIQTGSLNFDAAAVAAFVVCILLGFLTCSIIAGMAGASCSSSSETDGAMAAPMLLIMGGYLISMITSEFSGSVSLVTSLIPVLSVFCAPVQYLLGNIGFGTLLLSWLIGAAAAALLAFFCAGIYTELLVHKGSKVKPKEMLQMFRDSKKKAGVGR